MIILQCLLPNEKGCNSHASTKDGELVPAKQNIYKPGFGRLT